MAEAVVIGGGIAGLAAAHLLLARGHQVTLLERAPRLGGLLAGQVCEATGEHFDWGTHLFRETGVPALDEFFLSAPVPGGMLVWGQGTGNQAGAIFGGRLSLDSPFPDVRQAHWAQAANAELRQLWANESPLAPVSPDQPLDQVALARLGPTLVANLLAPALARWFGCPPEQLAWFAAELTGLTRAVVADSADWHLHQHNPRFRVAVAIANQADLPAQLRPTLRDFYPRHGGTAAFVQALAAQLAGRGARLVTSAQHIELLAPGQLRWRIAEGSEWCTQAADVCVFSGGVVPALGLLGLPMAPYGLGAPARHAVLHLTLTQALAPSAPYIVGFDGPVFRCTHYAGMTGEPDARLTVEVLGHADLAGQALADAVWQELCATGVVPAGAGLAHATTVHELRPGFPVPSLANRQALRAASQDVQRQAPWVQFCGLGFGAEAFFQNDVLRHVRQVIEEMA